MDVLLFKMRSITFPLMFRQAVCNLPMCYFSELLRVSRNALNRLNPELQTSSIKNSFTDTYVNLFRSDSKRLSGSMLKRENKHIRQTSTVPYTIPYTM